jgi:two-component system OmpR family response regulator|uniref:Response regulator n=1 Tax=Gracilinema caldarium TaxID=215591 RepID=A0A7C3EKH8_9SPIR
MAKNDKRLRIFSALEVANICGVVNQTAINWIRNGYLKAFTTPGGQYRVYAEDLKTFLDERGMRIPDELSELMQDEVEWKTILIVDDDTDLNGLMKKYLEKKLDGYMIYQAFDGFEAGKALANYRPGFIFLDIDLPGVDGHKLCKKIKEDPAFGKPFVIAMTGLDIPEEKRAILDEGADAFFGKPLDFEMVVKTVNELAAKLSVGVHE